MFLFGFLFATWLILSGYLEPFFIVSGILSCMIAVFYARKMDMVDKDKFQFSFNSKLFLYYVWLSKEILLSSFDVAIRMWQPKPNISPCLGWISSSQTTDLGKTTYANSITLTPGTVCIEVAGNDICVHALVGDGIKDLKTNRMDKKVTGVIK